MFKQITFFEYPADFVIPPDAAALLREAELKPVGEMELSSSGFVPPFGYDDRLVVATANESLITVGREDRMLPKPAVAAEVAKRIKAIEKAEGRTPGGRTRKRITEEVVLEFLPRAFVKPSRINAVIFHDLRIIAVGSASRKAVEDVISTIRYAWGSFPATPVVANQSVPARLSQYLEDRYQMPGYMHLGDEAWLESSDGATAKFQHQDLDADEVLEHLQAGKLVTRLALRIDIYQQFVLDDYLVVRKLQYLSGCEVGEVETVEDEMQARLTLFCGETRRLLAMLEDEFDTRQEDELQPAVPQEDSLA